jgi:hypothetical protein
VIESPGCTVVPAAGFCEITVVWGVFDVKLRLAVALGPVGVAMLSLALTLSSCASPGAAAPEGVFLPRLTSAPPRYGAAAIEGTLVEDRGCVELTKLYLSADFLPLNPGAIALVLWPEGSEAKRTDDGGLSVDAPDLPAAVTGQRVFLGRSRPWQTRSR